MSQLNMLKGITEIEYLCGAKYRGQLRGKFRHGVGMILYDPKDKPIIGKWVDDICTHDGVKHPIRELTAISVLEYD